MRHPAAAAAFVATLALVLISTPVTARATAGAETDDIAAPTWTEIEAAQGDEAATEALIARIDEALDTAQEQAAATSREAMDSQAAAQASAETARTSAARAEEIAAQAVAAQAQLRDSQQQASAVVSAFYRTQDAGTLTLRLLTSADPDDLLQRLGLLEQLSGTWQDFVDAARADAALAKALGEQSEQAADDAARAAEQSQQDAQEAQEAADAEQARVDELEEASSTLYAQLATLKQTSAAQEEQTRLAAEVAEQPQTGGRGSTSGSSSGSSTGSSGSSGGSSGSSGGSSGSSGDSSGSSDSGSVVVDPVAAQAYARSAISAYGWGSGEYSCLVSLWNRESGWRADALNPSSGAYGIPQALPAEKMAAAGADWRTNGNTQIDWGLSYISGRYGSPCAAWAHSEQTGWY